MAAWFLAPSSSSRGLGAFDALRGVLSMRILVLFLLLAPLHSLGESSAALRYLMNEPATLFDVAMLRLNRVTDYWEEQMVFNFSYAAKTDRTPGNVNAYYDSNADKIYVELTVMDELASEAQMKAGCRYALRHIAIYVGNSINDIFYHVAEKGSADQRELASEFREVFELRCYVSGRSSSEGRFWATRSLDSSEIHIGRWEVD